MKKVLMFSYNPVPTLQYTTIEGSALRFWRMALELRTIKKYDITIAIWQKFPQTAKKSKGIKIATFDDNDDNLKLLLRNIDVVVLSAAMGPLTQKVFDMVSQKTRVIVDAYSPMYVEFLTKSMDKKGDAEWMGQYKDFARVFSNCLIKADHILVGNKQQMHLYRGVLAGLGALPFHDDERFITLPAFVEKDDRVNQKVLDGKNKIEFLWFGGVYPWFDISDLIRAFADRKVSAIANLNIVGGSNPFYPKDNMRFNGKYIKAQELTKKLDLMDTTIKYRDWVDYDQRIEVFNSADVAISINNTFLENDYSFRLRVADLAGNGVPIATNGGDPLGEYLIAEQAAFRLTTKTPETLANSILKIINNKEAIASAKKRLNSGPLFNELHLSSHMNGLVQAIDSNTLPGNARTHTSEYIQAVEAHTRPTISIQPTSLNLDYIENVSTRNLVQVCILRIRSAVRAKARKIVQLKVNL